MCQVCGEEPEEATHYKTKFVCWETRKVLLFRKQTWESPINYAIISAPIFGHSQGHWLFDVSLKGLHVSKLDYRALSPEDEKLSKGTAFHEDVGM